MPVFEYGLARGRSARLLGSPTPGLTLNSAGLRSTLFLMNALLLAALVPFAAAAEGDPRKTPAPLPAEAPPDEYRVVVDEASEPREPVPPAPAPRRRGVARLTSVDAKERRVVLETEDGGEETLSVPESARLSFAPDERPLKLEQLRRGDAVAFAAEGGKAARLHLDLCAEGAGQGDENIFAPPPRRARRPRRPPPPEDEGPAYPAADEPDTPMYQSEPPEPKPAPAKQP